MENTAPPLMICQSIIRKLSRFGLFMGMGWVLVMMLLTTLDVVVRYLFSSPIPGALEMSEFLLAIFGLSGVAYTHGSGGNVRVTMLTGSLSVRKTAILNLITALFSCQIIVMLTWYGVVMGIEEFQIGTTTDSLGIPLYPLHFLLSLGGLLLALEIIMDIMTAISGIITGCLPLKES